MVKITNKLRKGGYEDLKRVKKIIVKVVVQLDQARSGDSESGEDH